MKRREWDSFCFLTSSPYHHGSRLDGLFPWTVNQKKPFLPPFLCPSLPSSLLTFFPTSLFPFLLKLLLSCHSNKKVTHTAAFWEWTKSFCLPFVDKFQLTLWPHLDAEEAERYFLHCTPPTSSELCKLTILVRKTSLLFLHFSSPRKTEW